MVTLSLGSWSTMLKSRVVGHGLPLTVEVPADGTTSLPRASSLLATRKNLVPLQNDTWPNTEPCSPSTHDPCRRARRVAPTWVRSVPLKPTSMVTMELRGSLGTTGATAGVVPWVMTSGS